MYLQVVQPLTMGFLRKISLTWDYISFANQNITILMMHEQIKNKFTKSQQI